MKDTAKEASAISRSIAAPLSSISENLLVPEHVDKFFSIGKPRHEYLREFGIFCKWNAYTIFVSNSTSEVKVLEKNSDPRFVAIDTIAEKNVEHGIGIQAI